MRGRVVSDFRLISNVCHALCFLLLLFVVVDRIPAVRSATGEVVDTSFAVASGESRPILEDVVDSLVAVPKTRSIRAAVLPLGHRYIGLGKRFLQASQAGGNHDKRPHSVVQDGAAMRYIGLGKRGGTRVVDSGLRFIGLGKRNSAAMRYIGLGKRPFYDGDMEEETGMEEDEDAVVEDQQGRRNRFLE